MLRLSVFLPPVNALIATDHLRGLTNAAFPIRVIAHGPKRRQVSSAHSGEGISERHGPSALAKILSLFCIERHRLPVPAVERLRLAAVEP